MRKVNPNALWNELAPEQQAMLDKWLYDDKLSYAKILPRAQKQLGFRGQMSSLKRYFQKRQQERLLTCLGEVATDAVKATEAGAKPEVLRAANMSVMNGYLFQALRESPEQLKELAPVIRAMLQNDYNESVRNIKDEEHKIRREAMAFAKERHQFALMETALKALPQLKELAEAKKDPHTQRYEENAYWNQARKAMFGMGIDVHPESAEEEAQMMAARRRREERRAQESDRERDAVTEAQPPVPASRHYPEYLATVARQELNEWNQCGEYEI